MLRSPVSDKEVLSLLQRRKMLIHDEDRVEQDVTNLKYTKPSKYYDKNPF